MPGFPPGEIKKFVMKREWRSKEAAKSEGQQHAE